METYDLVKLTGTFDSWPASLKNVEIVCKASKSVSVSNFWGGYKVYAFDNVWLGYRDVYVGAVFAAGDSGTKTAGSLAGRQVCAAANASGAYGNYYELASSGSIILYSDAGVKYIHEIQSSNTDYGTCSATRSHEWEFDTVKDSKNTVATAVANDGYVFVEFTGDIDKCTIKGNKCTIRYTEKSDVTITAVFAEIPRLICAHNNLTSHVTTKDGYGEVELPSVVIGFGGHERVGGNNAWFTNPEYGEGERVSDPYNLTENTYVYAQWSGYTVTFDANGGEFSQSAEEPPETTRSITVSAYSYSVVMPTPTRKGYDFEGWYENKDGGDRVGEYDEMTDTWSYIPPTNITLYAHWTLKDVTVTFDANGGTGGKTVKQKYGTPLSVPTVKRTGYEFAGWSPPSVPATMPAVNTIYTAQWTALSTTYKYNYTDCPADTTGTAVHNAPNPTRTGYTFAGWYSAATGGKRVCLGGASHTASGDTLYAHWNANTYTVTLYMNDGTTQSSSKTVTYGEEYGDLPRPMRTGYMFLDVHGGWYTAVEGGDKVTKTTKVATAADHALYAHWDPKKIYIQLMPDYEGGSVEPPLESFYDTPKEVPAPTRTGYVFTGWKITGFYSTDKLKPLWGTDDNPQTEVDGDTCAVGNPSTDSVWVKNLHVAKESTVKMTATWEHVKYVITAKNASTRWSVEISGDGGKNLPVELDVRSGSEVPEEEFTAYGGYSYDVKLKFDKASVAANTFYVPTTYGGHGLSRGEDEDGKAVFTCSYTFPSSDAAPQTWNAVSNTLTVAFSLPEGIEDDIPSPTMQFAESTGTAVRVTAEEKTDKLKFSYWSYDGVTPTSENREIVVSMSGGDATITAVYTRRRLEVSADVEETAASAVSGLSAYVTANEISEVHITNIGYGLPATWKFTGTIPDGYEFDGWYEVVEPGYHGPIGRIRLSENTVFTVSKVYGPLKLQARLRARLTFHVEVFGEGVSGKIGVNAKSYAELVFSEYFQLGRTINVVAVPGNDDSHFNGWFEGGVSHSSADSTRISGKTERMVYSVNKATDIVAYFTATAEVFFVALYQRDAATRSYNIPTPFGTLALATEEGAVDALSDYEEYKDKSGYRPPLSARGVYYQVTGIRRVDASLTQTETQTAGVKRVLRGIPDDRYRPGSGGADIRDPMEVANGMPFSAVIDADCSFIVDFGDTSHRNLEAKVVTGDAGGVARVQNAESVVETGDDYEIGRYEINSKAVAVAIPKNGYKFVGWYGNADGTGEKLSAKVRYEFTMPAPDGGDSAYAVYAKFSRGSFALYEWEGSSANKVLTWKSKVYELSKPANLTSVRVDTQHYPVFRFRYEPFSSPNAQAPNAGVVDFAMGEKDRRLQSQDMRRLPYVTPEGRHIRPERYFQVEVQNDAEIDAIIIGTSGEGLAT